MEFALGGASSCWGSRWKEASGNGRVGRQDRERVERLTASRRSRPAVLLSCPPTILQPIQTMLDIHDLHAAVGEKEILKGIRSDRSTPAKCTPSWARTARARARSPRCWPATRCTRSPAATVTYEGHDLLEMEPEERAQAGHLPRVPVSGGDPGRVERLFPPRRVQRDPQGARRGGGRSARVRRYHGREAQAGRDGSGDAQPVGERRLLRRREEAQRDPADGGARTQARDPRRDRLGARHRRAAHRGRRREQAQAPRQRDHRRHALSAAAQLHRARLRARAGQRAHREVRAARNWRWSSRRRATTGSRAARRRESARDARGGVRGAVPEIRGKRRGRGAGVGARAAQLRARAVHAARLPDHEERRLALHERGADRRAAVPAAHGGERRRAAYRPRAVSRSRHRRLASGGVRERPVRARALDIWRICPTGCASCRWRAPGPRCRTWPASWAAWRRSMGRRSRRSTRHS